MLLVIPFHAGDLSQTANLLTWLGQVRGGQDWRTVPQGTLYARHGVLLLVDGAVDWLQAHRLHEQARWLFHSTRLVCSEPSVTGWPQGPNALFARACVNCDAPWLWLEPDAVPLHRDWLDILEDEYRSLGAGRHFLGCLYDCNQPGLPARLLSGIAVYPPNWHEGANFTHNPNVAFDVAMTDAVLPYATHTDRIQHLWGEDKLPPTFPPAGHAMPRNGLMLSKLQGGAILFHRNKDGTLIQRLREREGFARKEDSHPPTRGLMRVRRTAAIGDVCAATVVAKKLARLGYEVEFQAHPATHCILRRIPGIHHICEPHGTVEIDLDGAYESNRNRRNLHFAQMFVDRANDSLRAKVIADARNFAPRMVMEPNDRTAALERFRDYPRPWTIICPRSQNWANRTVPDPVWCEAAAQIQGTKFWLGLHPAPPCAGIVDLQCRHFDRAIGFIGTADLLVTVDTGPMHIAAALGTPIVAIEQASSPGLHLSDQRDFIVISNGLHCLNCQLDMCPLNAHVPPCQNIAPAIIADAVNARLQASVGEGVSVVMAIYKPQAQKLNRALNQVLPQVDEIVVVSDAGGFVPPGALQHAKIRYVKMAARDLGYGRKANFGFRHTNHKFVLLLNDDVYLNPDAVAKMREVMTVNAGMVAHELRYLDGTIQHGGTYRAPGSPGWGHLDLRAHESRIKQALEMENVCGASVLVRREAFYQAGGFDEDFFLYCEDNALCLAIRQAGWQIWYTPHAQGTHEESQSTSVTQGIHEIMVASQRTLERKWGWYFKLNNHNTMGRFE